MAEPSCLRGGEYEMVQFAEKYFTDLKKVPGVVNGYNGYTWMIKTEEVSDFVITAQVVASTAEGITLTAAIDKTDKDFIAELDTDETTPTNYEVIEYYLNGTKYTDGVSNVKATYAPSTTVATAAAKKGAVVEFIDTDRDGYVNVINVIEKRAAKLVADPIIVEGKDKTTVTIASLGVASADVKDVVGYEGLKKDDVVLYWTSTDVNDGKTYIEKAEYITGTVDGYNNNPQTGGDQINGKCYKASQLTVAGGPYVVNSTVTSNKDTYNFYLDNGGYILTAVKVTENKTANYAVVHDIAWVVPNTTGAIGVVAKPYAEAKLVFTDGTSQIVKVADIDGYKPVAITSGTDDITDLKSTATHFITATDVKTAATGMDALITAGTSTAFVAQTLTSGEFYAIYKDSDTDITNAGTELLGKFLAITDASQPAGNTAIEAEIPESAFYAYTVNKDGSYSLSSTAPALSGDSFGAMTNDEITGGVVKFDGGATGIANANTVFIYASKDAKMQDVYTVYTGIANVPTTAANSIGNYTANCVVTNAGGVAAYVFADVSTVYSASKDVVYVTSDKMTTVYGDTTYYVYDAVINGKVTTVKSAADLGAGAVDFYAVTDIDKDGIYTLTATLTTIYGDDTKSGIKSTTGGILVLGDGTAYAYDEATPAYVIEKVGMKYVCAATTIEGLALDATDTVMYMTDAANTKIVGVYVVKVDEAPATMTLAGAGNAASVTDGNLKNNTADTVAATASTADQVKVTVAAQSNTTVKGITINGVDYISAATYTLTANGTYKVVVTIEDDFSKALSVHEYTFTVSGLS